MGSEFRRRTLLTWAALGAGGYGLERWVGPTRGEREGAEWHGRPIGSLAVSGSGAWVATGSAPRFPSPGDRSEGVVLWSVERGKPIWRRPLGGGVKWLDGVRGGLRFSRDSSLVGASSMENHLSVIGSESGQLLATVSHWAASPAAPFVFSEDGAHVFFEVNFRDGELGKVVPSRQTALTLDEKWVGSEDSMAVPFRLDEKGLHVVSRGRYLILGGRGVAPMDVGRLVEPPQTKVVVSPSGRTLAVMGQGGDGCLFDLATGVRTPLGRPNAVDFVFARESEALVILSDAPGSWKAELFAEGGPLRTDFSARKVTGPTLPDARPVALSPDGSQALGLQSTGQLMLWSLEPRVHFDRNLGRFEGATGAEFPSAGRAVVLGPRLLVFLELPGGRKIAEYGFPPGD